MVTPSSILYMAICITPAGHQEAQVVCSLHGANRLHARLARLLPNSAITLICLTNDTALRAADILGKILLIGRLTIRRVLQSLVSSPTPGK